MTMSPDAARARVRLRRRTVAVTALVTALLALTAACGQPAAPAEGAGEQAGPPRQGGSMIFTYIQESRGLDPIISSALVNTDATQMTAIYDGLLLPDPETGDPVPRLAESIEPDAEGLRWRLRLRPGLSFTDGTPFDAAAVKFNFDRQADPANRPAHIRETQGITVTAVDPLTVEYQLAAPNLNFDRFLALSALTFVASPTAVAQKGQAFADSPVGAGPFMVQEWVRDDHLTLVRNPDYWDAPKPYLDRLEIRIIRDQQAALNSIMADQIHIMPTTNPQMYERAEAAGLGTERYAVNGGLTISLNTRRPPFDDPRARRALALAIDRDAIVAATGGIAAANLVREDSPFYRPDTDQPPTSREEAQRLFDELAADGTPLSFAMTVLNVPSSEMIGEAMQAQLATYRNVSMSVDVVDSTLFQTKARVTYEFDAVQSNSAFGDLEPSLWDLFHTGGVLNLTGYSNPTVDAALERARAARSEQDRVAAFHEAMVQIAQDVPEYVYRQSPGGAIFSTAVTGATFFGDGRMLLSELGFREGAP